MIKIAKIEYKINTYFPRQPRRLFVSAILMPDIKNVKREKVFRAADGDDFSGERGAGK